MKRKTQGIILLTLFGLALAFMVYSYFSGGIVFSLVNQDTTKIISFLDSLGILAAVVIFLFIVIENVIAPVPPLVLYFIAGISYGGFWGGVLSLVGNVVGSTAAFFLAKSLGRRWVEKKTPKETREKFDKFSKKYGGFSIFLLRINPLTSTDLFSYLSGLSRISFKHFIIGTTLGLTPGIFLQTYLGDIFSGSTFWFNLFLLASVFYVVIFIAMFFYFKRKNKKAMEKNRRGSL